MPFTRLARSVPFFFFNDTATTEIYTLSLHDALPIYQQNREITVQNNFLAQNVTRDADHRSEEHTSELQSRENLVCRLLLEKKYIAVVLCDRPSIQCFFLPSKSVCSRKRVFCGLILSFFFKLV